MRNRVTSKHPRRITDVAMNRPFKSPLRMSLQEFVYSAVSAPLDVNRLGVLGRAKSKTMSEHHYAGRQP
eukprot:5982194-Pyramimonas_sp.AAC.1